jgi:hypothetical protein
MGTGRDENIGKPSYFNLPPDIGFTFFTPFKGRIDSLTVYIYKAETCTNILRYNTCMSSYPGDRKCTKIEPVSQKNAKNQCAVLPGISVTVLASHFSSVIGSFRSSGWLDLHV